MIAMRFGIVRNPYKPLAEAFLAKMIACINSVGAAAVPFYPDNAIPEVDMVISVGGDGTMLATARQVKEIPILGINLGHLGFLTNIEFDCLNEKESFVKLKQTFLKITQGQYSIDKRCRIEPVIKRNNEEFACYTALNDVVVKGAIAKLIRLQVAIGGEAVGNFPADGIIISTATGSTGYSLSCGGPIIPPDTAVNIITPISSHLLTARPLVAGNDKEITIVAEAYHKKVLVSVDGQVDRELAAGDEVIVRKAKFTTNLVRIQEEAFYPLLARKLNWSNC